MYILLKIMVFLKKRLYLFL